MTKPRGAQRRPRGRLDARIGATLQQLRGSGRECNDGAPGLYNTWGMLASAHNARGQPAEAAALLERSLARPAPDSPDQYRALCLVGRAAALLSPVLAGGTSSSVRLSALLVQAEAALALGHRADADRVALQAAQIAQRLQADNRWSARTGQALALRALATGDPALRAQALEHLRATVVPGERWRRRLEEEGRN